MFDTRTASAVIPAVRRSAATSKPARNLRAVSSIFPTSPATSRTNEANPAISVRRHSPPTGAASTSRKSRSGSGISG